MWDVKACRSCLTVKGKLEKIGDASKRQYAAITGLQISECDGYPSYFCVECRHHIRKSLAFRRKSRRAHFVLKEIMTVRKQISYSDIVTVNRKKTNLESSLNFWEPNNNSCFLVANEEGQEEDSLKKYDLEEPRTRFHSKQLVEIKPDQDIEVPVETNEQEYDDYEEFLPAIQDVPTNDYLEPLEPEPEIDTANIDMNDIFKDLTENVESDNDDFVEPLVKRVRNKLEQDNEVLKLTKQYSIITIVNSLILCDLKVLDLVQQKAVFELQKKTGPFAKAPYKCAMCLTIYKDMDKLVAHVNYHNERKYGCECQVCKNKFPTEENLNAHMANCHLYEYSCRICRSSAYTQFDAVKHAREKHSKEPPSANINLINRRQERKIMLSRFTITPLSQRMMSDVMLLRSRPEHNKSREPGQVKPGQECPYKCDICGVGRKQRQHLERHIVLKHRYMYTCKLCKEMFTTRLQALQHNEESHKKHQCEDCGKVYSKMNKLKSHCNKAHSKKLPCNLCGHAYRNEKQFYKHQFTEHGYASINDPSLGDPEYTCGTVTCGVQFANKRSLDVHIVEMNHAGAENVPNACVPCKKLYENEEELETHFITCRDASKYPRKCCYCTEVLRNAMEYKLHYIHQHPTLQYRYIKQNTICDICGKSIFRPMLETHLRTHSGSAYECRLCANVSAFPSAHISHLLANHARRPYRCSLCPRRFKIRADCKDHILKVHAPTKLFKCEFCEAEFSYFRNLKEHAEKLHDLLIPPIKPKIALKNKKTLYVYAHMKIIINEVERPVVQQLNVELLDYLEQKSKPVDCNDYFIFTPHAEEVSLCMKKRIRKRKKKEKKQTETERAVAHITVDWVNQGVKNEIIKLKDENSELKDENSELKCENSELKDEQRELKEEIQEVKISMATEEDNLEIDSEMPLEVVESDGQQYVMINGEMYRIAAEEDE